MIQTRKGRLYTGISTDPERRFAQHARGQGARYFRFDRPERIVFRETCADRSRALQREAELKKLSRRAKEKLLECLL
ncbi:MAG: GIY-YIG nuclease family protein [Spirochaetales bacterium]|nr:GIY-YIG nuclease family protein [Spirochaetales bacterium]